MKRVIAVVIMSLLVFAACAAKERDPISPDDKPDQTFTTTTIRVEPTTIPTTVVPRVVPIESEPVEDFDLENIAYETLAITLTESGYGLYADETSMQALVPMACDLIDEYGNAGIEANADAFALDAALLVMSDPDYDVEVAEAAAAYYGAVSAIPEVFC